MHTLACEAFQKTSGLRVGSSEGEHAAESKSDCHITNFLLGPQRLFYKSSQHTNSSLHELFLKVKKLTVNAVR